MGRLQKIETQIYPTRNLFNGKEYQKSFPFSKRKSRTQIQLLNCKIDFRSSRNRFDICSALGTAATQLALRGFSFRIVKQYN